MARLFGVYFLEKYTAFKASLLQYIEEVPKPASKQCLPNIALESFFQSQTRWLQ
jgi:hypothetical protein